MKNSAVIVIPARYQSTRFPGKPLALIKGKAVIERVYQVAMATGLPQEKIFVATDDQRIKDKVESFGGNVIMTSTNPQTGTDRVLEAILNAELSPEIIVNLQGDQPLMPPFIVKSLIDELTNNQQVEIATPAMKLTEKALQEYKETINAGMVGGTTVVFDNQGYALYFSKGTIPYTLRGDADIFLHIGLYAFRPNSLKRFCQLPQSRLELAEGLEQLRALENQMKIKVTLVDPKKRSFAEINNPADIEFAEKIIDEQGEVVQ
ncbi:MAG TPA: 3-deoxy-manno-octulosonate cytidylyltransferase [Oligoflexia bacterium]|nr:3-deoxy-manno-octulosonate cytidylyltransferase [Oligoflexia bacterium]HMP26815.1 3-deoxy-manno-octulosonate cytidylyltransferase [Oligoflexia bacterium]